MERGRLYLLGGSGTLLLLVGELAGVKSELLTLEDVTVSAADLTGAGRDAGQETTSLEGGLNGGLELAGLLTDEDGLREGSRGSGGGISRGSSGGRLLLGLTKGDSVVLLVPLLEGGSVDLNDGSLDEGVGANQLVGDGVVRNDKHAGLASAVLRGPGEVSVVQTQSAVLGSSSADANSGNLAGSHTSHRGLATHLVLTLRARDLTLSSGGTVLVQCVACNTHFGLYLYK